MENVKSTKKLDVRRLVFTALLSSLAYVLAEFLSFKVPIMPSFLTFDFSDAPAMLASLTMGPVSGAVVCLIKNLLGCITSKTMCIGELSNFILGVSLVVPAGIIAHGRVKFSRAVIAGAVGAVVMAVMGFFSNFLLIYPLYGLIGWSTEVIIGLYQKILPSVDNLAQCLLIFNVPFTFVKGAFAAVFSIILYKKLRPIFNSMYRE
ncbi:MAG: ECF transporter S component [Oscillospiraceae bacterium]|nr:ECF transporter S component [Oscillospiraceae bacterium]